MPETRLKIKLFGARELRKRAKAVRQATDLHRDILSEMAQLMYDGEGIGLAAPQVGINEAMIVVDIGTGLYKLVNPKVVKRKGSQTLEEGCLSVPGVCINVKRAKSIEIQAQDEFGRHLTLDAEGLLACVFQHEIDHLKGILIVDYASFLQRIKIDRRLREIKKRPKDEKLPESRTKSCQLQL